MDRLAEVEAHLNEQLGGSSGTSTTEDGAVFKPYKFRMEELDGFRYRARDAWRAVTKIAVREARLKELKHELLNSSKLRSHFEANPRDAQALRHDRALHTVKHQAHLKGVPDYIIPPALRKLSVAARRNNAGGGGHRKPATGGHHGSQAKRKFEKNKADPLRSLLK
jgi:ATP-dependent RNA helicase DDX56/DBP9